VLRPNTKRTLLAGLSVLAVLVVSITSLSHSGLARAAAAVEPPSVAGTFRGGVGVGKSSVNVTNVKRSNLLVAFVAADGPAVAHGQTAGVQGTGLSWRLVGRANAEWGDSEIWAARASTAVTSVPVMATIGSGGFYDVQLTVMVFTHTAGVGATAVAAASSGAPGLRVLSHRQGSSVYGVGNDWQNAAPRSLAASQTLVDQTLTSTDDTYWVQGANSLSSWAGQAVALGDTAPVTDQWNLAALEVMGQTGSTSTTSTVPETTTTSGPGSTTTVPRTTTTGPGSTTTTTVPRTTTTVPRTTTTTTAPATTTTVPGGTGSNFASVYRQWSNGPDPSGANTYFPIGVWEQSGTRQENGKANALNYEALGINVDVNGYDPSNNWPTWQFDGSGPDGLGPPFSQSAGTNQGLFLADEPDMNQVNEATNNDLTSVALQKEAAVVRAWDPTRPTYVNFGKCMSISQWDGCHTDIESPPPASYRAMMQQYCSAADIESADYYGYTDPYEPTSYHGAYTYGLAIVNDKAMCGAAKPTLGFVETGHPFTDSGTITPAEIQAAVWDEVLHGANGVIYFVHDFFTGGYTEDGLLTTEAAAKPTVLAVDSELAQLAPVLNSPTVGGVTVKSTGGVPVTTMLKVYAGHTYLFAMADGNSSLPNSASTTATISVPGVSGTSATVVNENRSVAVSGGTVSDSFSPYQVHVYEFGS
jgi:hypothetical protein